MKLEFVNHASFIIDTGSIRMISDPWLEGYAFNKGWSLLSPTKFQYDDFKDITHLWFSHEHPDHFAPPNLFKIPEEHRRNITVFYQATEDGKVAGFCRKLGFKEVIELEDSVPYEVEPGFELTCQPYSDGDSWLLVKTPDCKLLNLNDCLVFTQEAADEIHRLTGDVDVLMTQFSISSWDGNPEDRERRFTGARNMALKALMQIDTFKAKQVIPFASYVWFCHEENFWINEAHNRIDDFTREIAEKTAAQPVVLYPGDSWTVGEAHSPDAAVARYQAEFDGIAERDRVPVEEVSREELIESGDEFRNKLFDLSGGTMRLRLSAAKSTCLRRMKRGGGKLAALAGLAFLNVEPAKVWIGDHKQAYLFDFFKGLRPSPIPREQCDIEMGADSLRYAFKNNWGGESLQVNGRFVEIYPNGKRPIFDMFGVAGAVNVGRAMSWKTLPAGIWRTVTQGSR